MLHTIRFISTKLIKDVNFNTIKVNKSEYQVNGYIKIRDREEEELQIALSAGGGEFCLVCLVTVFTQ